MTHRERVDRLIVNLKERGVSAYTVAPPFFRMLWLLGLNVPPPFFLGFFTLTLLMGGFFGVFWGLFMWLLQWQFTRLPLEMAVLGSVLAGLLFGLSMAAYYRWKAAKMRLPPWQDYGGHVVE